MIDFNAEYRQNNILWDTLKCLSILFWEKRCSQDRKCDLTRPLLAEKEEWEPSELGPGEEEHATVVTQCSDRSRSKSIVGSNQAGFTNWIVYVTGTIKQSNL